VEGYASECRRICPFFFVPFGWSSDILYTLSDITACPKPAPPIPSKETPAEKPREKEKAEREEEMTEEERKAMKGAEEEYKKRMAEIYPRKLEVKQIMIKDGKGHTVNGVGRLHAGESFTVHTVIANRSTDDVDADVYLAVDDSKVKGTDREVHIYGGPYGIKEVSTITTPGFDLWTVKIAKPNEYNLCVVARPISTGIEAAKGCKRIHILPK
jgi:hypothetical protein